MLITDTQTATIDSLVPQVVEPLAEAYELGYQAGFEAAKAEIAKRLEALFQTSSK